MRSDLIICRNYLLRATSIVKKVSRNNGSMISPTDFKGKNCKRGRLLKRYLGELEAVMATVIRILRQQDINLRNFCQGSFNNLIKVIKMTRYVLCIQIRNGNIQV